MCATECAILMDKILTAIPKILLYYKGIFHRNAALVYGYHWSKLALEV